MDHNKALKVVFQKRRDYALRSLEERKQEIYTFIPKIKSIENQIKKMGLKVAMASLKDPDKAVMELRIIEEEVKVLQREKAILLTEHNIPHDFLTVDFKCKTCNDTGFLANGKQCHCYKQELIKYGYKNSNITDVLNRENFSTFDITVFSNEYNEMLKSTPREHMKEVQIKALEFVENFNKKNQQNLLFYGETGLGKTFLCNCIAKSLLDSGNTVLYQTSFKIIDTISSFRFTNPKTDAMRFNYNLLIECDLLIIDDLGTEMINSFSNTELFNIVNSRMLKDKKTIISTNFTPQQISENYSERIASRLFGNYDFIAFLGEDLRWGN